jgi:aryl-alcohol dehydrogenase-like predicted oxidoreductase
VVECRHLASLRAAAHGRPASVKYRKFGTTGLQVSELGLGAWQLGNRKDWADGPDERASLQIIGAALDAGVTFFDTAPNYAEGRSGRLLGQGLRGHRDEVVLCTKFGHTPEGTDFSAASLRGSIEASLRQLQTDVIDIVLMHNPPPEMYDGRLAPHYELLDEIKQEGLIRAYGASVDWPQDIDTVLATTDSKALEVYLSVFHQETWDAVERAGAAGVGSVVKVALESGWLAGTYNAESVFCDVRSRWTPQQVRRRAALTARFLELVPPGWTPARTALRFALANPGVATVIPGSKSLAQLTDNLRAAQGELPADVLAALRELFAREIEGDPVGW